MNSAFLFFLGKEADHFSVGAHLERVVDNARPGDQPVSVDPADDAPVALCAFRAQILFFQKGEAVRLALETPVAREAGRSGRGAVSGPRLFATRIDKLSNQRVGVIRNPFFCCAGRPSSRTISFS
jgi:hypothetical protein